MTDHEKMIQIINEAEELVKKHANSSSTEFKAWHSKTERFLFNKFGEDSIEYRNFKRLPFSPQVVFGVHDYSIECVRDLNVTIAEIKDYLSEEEEEYFTGKDCEYHEDYRKIFIIHGHDGELRESLARVIESQSIEAIVLNEKVNKGKTIIEKFEEHSDVGAAIALFTNDDLGKPKDSNEYRPRARQNVVFESGYFMGKLGRNKVIIVAEKGVELPSDLNGVVYTDATNWEIDVLRELKSLGFKIDLNLLF